MEVDEAQLRLKWHNFRDTVLSYFGHLRDEEEFVDVTIFCDGKIMRAHKIVLAASSPYLESLLEENPCKHPCIILDDVPYSHLEALLSFVYTGKAHVAEEELPAFLDSANLLKVRGLSEVALSQNLQPQKDSDGVNTLPDNSADRVMQCSIYRSSSLETEVELNINDKAPKVDDLLQHSPQNQQSSYATKLRRRPSDVNSTSARDEATFLKRQSSDDSLEDSPSSKRSARSNSVPPFQMTVKVEEVQQPIVALAEVEAMARSIPGPDPFLRQVTLNWRQDMDPLYQSDARKRQHSLDPRPCHICKRVYSNLSNLRQHLRLIHNPKFVTCHLCSKTFKTDLYLRRHIIGYHELSNVDAGAGLQEGTATVPLSVVEVHSYGDSSESYGLQSALTSIDSIKGPVIT